MSKFGHGQNSISSRLVNQVELRSNQKLESLVDSCRLDKVMDLFFQFISLLGLDKVLGINGLGELLFES